MLKNHPIIKWSLISLGSIVTVLLLFGFWLMSLVPSDKEREHLTSSHPKDLSYLTQSTAPSRGKILAVVTSHSIMGNSGKSTGYELTELARPYYVFQANGFEVEVASPLGGMPPVVIDWEDMGEYDFAFLNDSIAQQKVRHSIPIEEVTAIAYEAIFFVGGKGAMYDFPDNKKIQSLVRTYYHAGKVVGAVCHGPAALINVILDNGQPLLANKTVSGFTNEEELFLIPDAKDIFPFLLQDKMIQQGASVNTGHLYLEKVSIDGNIVTGQNPWSTWAFAEAMVRQLGYIPVLRTQTAEENTITILSLYEDKGYTEAKSHLENLASQGKNTGRTLLAMHSFIAVIQWDLSKAFDLVCLLVEADRIDDK